MMSSERTLDPKKSARKNKRKDRQSQRIKLPPVIYDPTKKPDETIITEYNNSNSFALYKEQVNNEAKEIANYYLQLHKNMINTFNSVCFQILLNSSSLSRDIFFTNTEQLVNYQKDVTNMYTKFISNKEESLKLIDNIITNNLDTFIESIKLTQKFYKDIIESYLTCITNHKQS